MGNVSHREDIEIDTEHGNIALASARSQTEVRAVTPAVPGRKLLTLVAVSFGLLCVLQATLNVCLRFTLWPQSEENQQIDMRCPFYWYKFQKSCYFVSASKKSWEESRQDCLQRGANLVIINSRGEQAFLKDITERFWIGLSDIDKEGQWRWVDGSELTNGFWGEGEPNSQGEEDCVEFVTQYFAWNDNNCSTRKLSVCEKLGPT